MTGRRRKIQRRVEIDGQSSFSGRGDRTPRWKVAGEILVNPRPDIFSLNIIIIRNEPARAVRGTCAHRCCAKQINDLSFFSSRSFLPIPYPAAFPFCALPAPFENRSRRYKADAPRTLPSLLKRSGGNVLILSSGRFSTTEQVLYFSRGREASAYIRQEIARPSSAGDYPSRVSS